MSPIQTWHCTVVRAVEKRTHILFTSASVDQFGHSVEPVSRLPLTSEDSIWLLRNMWRHGLWPRCGGGGFAIKAAGAIGMAHRRRRWVGALASVWKWQDSRVFSSAHESILASLGLSLPPFIPHSSIAPDILHGLNWGLPPKVLVPSPAWAFSPHWAWHHQLVPRDGPQLMVSHEDTAANWQAFYGLLYWVGSGRQDGVSGQGSIPSKTQQQGKETLSEGEW